MLSRTRIVAAAFGGCAGAALLAAALASGAPGRSADTVTLQVAPRGPGAVSTSPNGVDLNGSGQPCKQNDAENDCRYGYESGKTVTLTAKPDSGKSFSGWSTPDCPGTGSCTVTLDQDLTTIVATFSPLQLGVRLSSDSNGDVNGKVTSSPSGINCTQEECRANFQAHQTVTLTATPNPGHTFKDWTGCKSTDGNTCTVSVDDQPTWAGARFDNDDKLQLPTTITVEFQVRRGGNGSGRVTASKIDCGTVCTSSYGFGKTITLTAKADDGSLFDGWNGVCAKTQLSCTFAVGPLTSIRALFARDTTPPTTPGGLAVKSSTRTSVVVDWTASTDNVGVTGYGVYLNGDKVNDTTTTEYTFVGLACGRSYEAGVDAADAVANRSPRATLTVQTQLCALAARLAGVAVQQAAGRRTIVAKVRVNRATSARLTLLRGIRSAATARRPVKPGTNALRLGVPKRLPGGPYRLKVVLVNPDGGLLALPVRGVLLPRPR